MSALAWVIVGVLGRRFSRPSHRCGTLSTCFLGGSSLSCVCRGQRSFLCLGRRCPFGRCRRTLCSHPKGYELSLIVTSVIVFRFSATLSGRGAIWCAVYRRKYRVSNRDIVFVELGARPCWVCKPATAALFPTGFATDLAALSHGLFVKIEKRRANKAGGTQEWV